MKSNMNKTDRMIRIAIGGIIAALGIYYQSWLGLIAIIPLGTALVNWCALYALLGIRTGGNKAA